MISRYQLYVDNASGKTFTADELARAYADAWDNSPVPEDEEDAFIKRFLLLMKANMQIVTKCTYTDICLFAPFIADDGKIEARPMSDQDLKDFEEFMAG